MKICDIKAILNLYCTKQCNIDILSEVLINSNIDATNLKKLLYNTVGIIESHGPQKAYDYINKNINNGFGFLFDCDDYEKIIELDSEEQEFIKNPTVVVEGVNKCYKCGNCKTISFNKQTRSADEGTTVFCCCYICGNRWKM